MIQNGILKTFYQLTLKTTKAFRFIKNFGQNFQTWGQKIFDDFMVPNDTGRTTEDI